MDFLNTPLVWRLLVTICGFNLLLGVNAQAQEPASWQVQPKVCIVEQIGEVCELALQIKFSGLSERQYCLYLNDTQLDCFTAQTRQDLFTLQVSANSRLTLRDSSQQIVLSSAIELKARAQNRKTRRVRQPWSLF